MKNLPDHGDAFWDMFPKDKEGNTIIEELDPEKIDEYPLDSELAEFMKSMEVTAA
ncbi:MAG: hypothetical protein RR178_07090 [Gordonibacter sp.]